MSICSRGVTLAVLCIVPTLAGCGSSGDSTAPAPASTTVYTGAFADIAQSGSFALTLASGASDLAPSAASAALAPTLATGTLTTVDGTSVSLTGTFDAASGALDIFGGAYKLTGIVHNGVLSGAFMGTHGDGAFAAEPTASGATPKVYCGTYAAPKNDIGWFNIVTAGSGRMSGVAHSIVLHDASSVTLTGTLSGTSLTFTSSDGATATGTVSSDGSSLSGGFTLSTGTGSFQGATNTCGGATGGANAVGIAPLAVAGTWGTAVSASTEVNAALLVTGTAISGSGAIHVAIPEYTGDAFVITSGTFNSPNISFSASLGANPDGHGGLFVGSLSFVGTVSGPATMTGTLTYTPPRTATQNFATQTVAGVTLTKA
jgi:hypothetical protein